MTFPFKKNPSPRGKTVTVSLRKLAYFKSLSVYSRTNKLLLMTAALRRC